MVKIIDIEISKLRLAGRIVYGLFWAAIILFFFYYLPMHFQSLLTSQVQVPQAYLPTLNSLAQSFSTSPLPYLGIIIATLAFIEAIINGTWVYGVILIVTGTFWLMFDLALYRSGLLFANLIPPSIFSGYQFSQSTSSLLIEILTAIVIIFVISSAFTIASGVRILARKRRIRARAY